MLAAGPPDDPCRSCLAGPGPAASFPPARAAGALLASAFAVVVSACGPVAGAATAPLPAQAATRSLAIGVTYRYEWRGEGPWAIHSVEIARWACGVSAHAIKAGTGLTALAPTSELARGPWASARPALAAINGDFFRADPLGVPEGPQISFGEPVAAEGSHGPSVSARFGAPQAAFGVLAGGAAFVGEARLEGAASSTSGGQFPLARVNAPPGQDSLALFNRHGGVATSADAGVLEVAIRLVDRAPAGGEPARGVVLAIDSLPAGLALDADRLVLAGRGRAASWIRLLAPGDTLSWTVAVGGFAEPVTELIGGFPRLLRQGATVLHEVPTLRPAFSEERHPRSAVGLRPDGTVVLLAVDGRRPGYSEGMTLPELATLLHELRVTEALNLDGGGSTTLVVQGQVANRPSDAGGERPVTNALVVLGPGPGECVQR
jgi:large repetitive protein